MVKECMIERCKNQADSHCYHCSQDVCTNHANEHKTWVEKQLLPVVNRVDTMYDHCHQIEKDQTMCTLDYLSDIREQVDQWKTDCYQQIDTIYDQVLSQIKNILEKHKTEIVERATNNLESIKQMRNQLGQLLKDDKIEYRLIENITEELEEIKQVEPEINHPNIRIFTEQLNVENLVRVIDETNYLTRSLERQVTQTVPLIYKNSIRFSSPIHSDEEQLPREQIIKKSYAQKKSVRPSLPISKKPIDKSQMHRRTFPKYKSYHDRISHLDEHNKKK
ncbi:hypothetical protein I4U23_000298 [Adineta vaga]|nr:hypothetical protein I4U23_000298 [Adineta vaga]